MIITIDDLLKRITLNKEELERLEEYEIRTTFLKSIDIANGYGLRRENSTIYIFTDYTNRVNLSLLSPPFTENSYIEDIWNSDYTIKYENYIVEFIGNQYWLVFSTYFAINESIVIDYYTPYEINENQVDINPFDLNILTLIFDGLLHQKIGNYYAKLSMKDIGADITTNLDRARYYQEQSSRLLTDAINLIRRRLPKGKVVRYRKVYDWLTH